MNTYAIQYRSGYVSKTVHLYAMSAQDAVDLFRVNYFESIIAVFRLEKDVDWE